MCGGVEADRRGGMGEPDVTTTPLTHICLALCAYAASRCPAPQIRRPLWVGKMDAVEGPTGGWRLTGGNKSQGVYDAVVIAHNGKCANRCVGVHGAVSKCLDTPYKLLPTHTSPLRLVGPTDVSDLPFPPCVTVHPFQAGRPHWRSPGGKAADGPQTERCVGPDGGV